MGMRTIVDVLEKLKVDDISFEKFPIDGTFDEIVKFLEEERFEDVQINNGASIDKEFNSEKSKCFTTLDFSAFKSIWFADTSKGEISKKESYILYMV